MTAAGKLKALTCPHALSLSLSLPYLPTRHCCHGNYDNYRIATMPTTAVVGDSLARSASGATAITRTYSDHRLPSALPSLSAANANADVVRHGSKCAK